MGLERRWDLREILAAYQESEADLRIEVARSWPDLDLGPGLFFDHGVGKWTLGLGVPDLVLHGNRAAIAEAVARRAVAASRVREVEERVLNEVEAALAACHAARAERMALDLAGIEQRSEAVEAAYARGEVGRLDLVLVRVERARTERRRIELDAALERAGAALARVTDAWPAVEQSEGAQ